MKKLILLLGILCYSSQSWGAFVIANTKNLSSAGGAPTAAVAAFTNALTNPSVIVVHIFDVQNTGATYSCADTAGNTYVDVGPGKVLLTSSARITQAFITNNTHTTASNVVTCTISTGNWSNPRIIATEITGAATSSTIDGGVGVGFSSNPNAQNVSSGANVLLSTTITPAGSGDLILSMFSTTSALATAGTSPNAFTSINTAGTISLDEYFVQSVSAAIVATAGDTTTSDNYNNITIALKPAAGATPKRLRGAVIQR